MKPLPKISIVIPSYNKVKYIGQTLESIVTQNYSDLEVIVQDGGSTDGTVEIIKKYAEKYPDMIFWTSGKDEGQLDAINKGLKKTTGEILTFINADDVYEKGALRAVGEYFAKNPETLWLAGRGRVIDEKGKEISKWVTAYKNLLLTVNSYSLLLIVNYLMQPSVFLSKGAYQKYGPFTGTENFVTEYDMWLRLAKLEMPASLSKNLSEFRIEKGTKTKTMFIPLLNEDQRIIRKHTDNSIILFLHSLHNLVRMTLGRFV